VFKIVFCLVTGHIMCIYIISKWFIIVTCAYIYIIIYNYIYKHTKRTRPYGPISHQINKYIN